MGVRLLLRSKENTGKGGYKKLSVTKYLSARGKASPVMKSRKGWTELECDQQEAGLTRVPA